MNSLNVKDQGKSSNQLAFHCQLTRIYENFKERYFRCIKVQVDCLNNSEPDSYEKRHAKESECLG